MGLGYSPDMTSPMTVSLANQVLVKGPSCPEESAGGKTEALWGFFSLQSNILVQVV